MAGPSLYKPRRTIRSETGAEVDTSVSALLVGVVGLLLLLATFVGMISYSAMSRPALLEENARPNSRDAVDIGVQPVPAAPVSP